MTSDEDWERLADAAAAFLERAVGIPGLSDAPVSQLAVELERLTPDPPPAHYVPRCGRRVVFPDNLGSAPCACNGEVHPLESSSG